MKTPSPWALLVVALLWSDCLGQDGPEGKLAEEVRAKGWIIYSAPSGSGDWDLFLVRPDGSERKNLTRSPAFHEAGAKFSPDGRKILYYRLPKDAAVDNNTYGTYELVIANSDGGDAVAYGKQYPWASWGPDGRQIACLSIKGIVLVDLAGKQIVRRLERKGMVQQLGWSPDGKWLCGTANGLGEYWAIGRISVATGAINAVSDTDCYNCTPDWFPDSAHIIYSKGLPRTEGWAQLWMSDGEGRQRTMIYGEIGRHIYGGALSPDGRYVLFTRSEQDLGKVDNSRTRMALMRLGDAPIVGGKSEVLRKLYPNAKTGPVLDLSWGWEPHWTSAEVLGKDWKQAILRRSVRKNEPPRRHGGHGEEG